VLLCRHFVHIDDPAGAAVCPACHVSVERPPISFHIPVLLSAHEFDDTEMILVARNALHRTFMELAAMSVDWELTPAELQRLSNLNLRPAKPAERKSPIGIAP
jgi:hypothetical protein